VSRSASPPDGLTAWKVAMGPVELGRSPLECSEVNGARAAQNGGDDTAGRRCRECAIHFDHAAARARAAEELVGGNVDVDQGTRLSGCPLGSWPTVRRSGRAGSFDEGRGLLTELSVAGTRMRSATPA